MPFVPTVPVLLSLDAMQSFALKGAPVCSFMEFPGPGGPSTLSSPGRHTHTGSCGTPSSFSGSSQIDPKVRDCQSPVALPQFHPIQFFIPHGSWSFGRLSSPTCVWGLGGSLAMQLRVDAACECLIWVA